MANENTEAIRFTNEKVRIAADKLASAYFFAKQVRDEWYANNLGSIIEVSADVIADGSAADGRHPLNGSDVTLVINRCEDIITDMEANSNAKLNTVLKAAVNY